MGHFYKKMKYLQTETTEQRPLLSETPKVPKPAIVTVF